MPNEKEIKCKNPKCGRKISEGEYCNNSHCEFQSTPTKKEIKCCKECKCPGLAQNDALGQYHLACGCHDGSWHNSACICHTPTDAKDWQERFDKKFASLDKSKNPFWD